MQRGLVNFFVINLRVRIMNNKITKSVGAQGLGIFFYKFRAEEAVKITPFKFGVRGFRRESPGEVDDVSAVLEGGRGERGEEREEGEEGEEGGREEGRKGGRNEGREEGRKEGRKEGRREEKGEGQKGRRRKEAKGGRRGEHTSPM
jgi:hypothetical protein